MGAALAIETGKDEPVDGVESLWFPVERQSLTERADAASKAHDLPWRTRMQKIWQFSDDEIDEMEIMRAEDMLNASLMSPPPTMVTERLSAAIPPPPAARRSGQGCRYATGQSCEGRRRCQPTLLGLTRHARLLTCDRRLPSVPACSRSRRHGSLQVSTGMRI